MYRNSYLLALIALVLLFTACNRTETPGVDPARTLSGDVQNWGARGSATLNAVASSEIGEPLGTLATTTIAANGSFELTLPATVDNNLLIDSGTAVICEGGTITGSANPSTWRETFAELMVEQNNETIGFLARASSEAAASFEGAEAGDFFLNNVYIDRDVTIQLTCTYPEGMFAADANLKQGWNLIMFTFEEVEQGMPTRARITTPTSVPTGVNWYFVSTDGSPVVDPQGFGLR